MSYEMPMPSVYFYDITKSPAYEITFAIMCYATYCTALINVSKTHDILDIIESIIFKNLSIFFYQVCHENF